VIPHGSWTFLAVSSRGKIIGRPPEEEDIKMKVIRLIKEKLQSAPAMWKAVRASLRMPDALRSGGLSSDQWDHAIRRF